MKNPSSVFRFASSLAALLFVVCLCTTQSFAKDSGLDLLSTTSSGFDVSHHVACVADFPAEVNAVATDLPTDAINKDGAEVFSNSMLIADATDQADQNGAVFSKSDQHAVFALGRFMSVSAGFLRDDQCGAAIFARNFGVVMHYQPWTATATRTCSSGFLFQNASTPGDVQVISNFTSTAGSFLPGMIMNINNMGAAESNFFLQTAVEANPAS